MILTKGIEIQPRHLPSYLAGRRLEPLVPKEQRQDLAVLDQVERDLIARALERNRGQTAEAAKELGIHRSTLWRKKSDCGFRPDCIGPSWKREKGDNICATAHGRRARCPE